jgi:catechol-2,3-dioxygenase
VEIKGLTISVTDLESVAEFYEDLLGMREVRSASRERTYRFGEHELHLVLEENLEVPSRFGVLVDDIGELHVRAAAGNWIAKEGECDLVWTERDGSTRILLQDPSGNLIEASQARS